MVLFSEIFDKATFLAVQNEGHQDMSRPSPMMTSLIRFRALSKKDLDSAHQTSAGFDRVQS